MDALRVACAGAVVRDDRGRLLLVRRGTEPGRGLWSIPGGRVEPGETAEQAAVREVAEETGLRVVLEGYAGGVERVGPRGEVYVIDDFHAVVAAGTDPGSARAGDDADDVRWVSPEELTGLPCVDGLADTLDSWGVLARRR